MSLPPRAASPVPPGPGYAVLDFETTGPVPGRDRAVEVGVVCCDPDGAVVREWTTLLDPEQRSTGPVHLHGISPEAVAHAPTFAAVAPSLASVLAGRVLVAHHADFDLLVLRAELARAGVLLPEVTHLCTLRASRLHLPALRRRRLADCCAATGVPLVDAHTALGDARATAGLLRAYLRLATPPQRSDLDDLVARAAAAPWPAVPGVPGLRRTPLVRGQRPPQPAGPGRLAVVVAALPPAPPLPPPSEQAAPSEQAGPTGAADAYAGALADELGGGTLTEDGVRRLADLAAARGLSRPDVLGAHRGALRVRAAQVADTGPRHAEQVLRDLAAVLALDAAEAAAALDAVRAERRAGARRQLASLPGDWAHGEPLRLGDRVAFTGCDDVLRRLLERRTREAGLAVAGAVSGTTALLVTDDPASGTVKARTARQTGTRTVDPDLYALLLEHVQPPEPGRATG